MYIRTKEYNGYNLTLKVFPNLERTKIRKTVEIHNIADNTESLFHYPDTPVFYHAHLEQGKTFEQVLAIKMEQQFNWCFKNMEYLADFMNELDPIENTDVNVYLSECERKERDEEFRRETDTGC